MVLKANVKNPTIVLNRVTSMIGNGKAIVINKSFSVEKKATQINNTTNTTISNNSFYFYFKLKGTLESAITYKKNVATYITDIFNVGSGDIAYLEIGYINKNGSITIADGDFILLK